MNDIFLYKLRRKNTLRSSNAGRRYYQLVTTPQDRVPAPDGSFVEVKAWIESERAFQSYVAINYAGNIAPLNTMCGVEPSRRRRVEECIRWFLKGKESYMVYEARTFKIYNLLPAPFVLYDNGAPVASLPTAEGADISFSLQLTAPHGHLEPGESDIDVHSPQFKGLPLVSLAIEYCAPLPDYLLPGDYVIVSLPYARAYRMAYGDDARLLCPCSPVTDSAGDIIGYSSLYHPIA